MDLKDYENNKENRSKSLFRVTSGSWLWSRLALGPGLLLVFWLATQQWVVPENNGPKTEETGFSALKAMRHLDVIASQPRPVGSKGQRITRSYLKKTLTQMGLEPQSQQTSTALRFPDAPGYSAGTVENIMVRLPGTDSTGAIALNAHYDGAATGPGAADCGSCVSVVLETLRVILEGPPLKNDLIVVFSDAEEVGDLGAHAFATQHPWMKDIRLAINYEAMGTGGPAYLYATSQNNSKLVESYANAVPWNMSNSFIVGVFGLVPQQRLACDLQDYLDAGSSGFGFVFTGNTSAYHTRLDNRESLDAGTVKQLGDNTLALLYHYNDQDLTKLESDSPAVFFTLWPGLVIHYSAKASVPLAVIGLCLLTAVLLVGVRKKKLKPGKIGIALVLFFLAIALSFAMTTGVWYMFHAFNPNLQTALIGNWAVEYYLAGLLILAATIMLILSLSAAGKINFRHQIAGSLSGFAVLSLIVSLVFPVGSYVFTWPLLAGTLAILWILLDEMPGKYPWATAGVVLGVLATGITLFFPIMTGPNPFIGLLIRLDALTGAPLLTISGIFAAMLAGMAIPFIAILLQTSETALGKKRWMLPAIGFMTSVAIFGVATNRSGYDLDHPRPESIRYEYDADTGGSHWVTGDAIPGEWISSFLPPDGIEPSTPGSSLLEYWPTTYTGSAPTLDLQHPNAQMLEDRMVHGQRIVRFNIKTAGSGYMLFINILTDSAIRQLNLNQRPIDLEGYHPSEKGELKLSYAACPPEGIELEIALDGSRPVLLSLVEISDGLPQFSKENRVPRPQTTMPSPLTADYTVVRKNLTF